jgi:hypothetical protein
MSLFAQSPTSTTDETRQGVGMRLALARVRLVLADEAYRQAPGPATKAELIDAAAEVRRLSAIPMPSLIEGGS